jgi:hypothetical protein
MLASMGLTGVIPVGNADAGAYFNTLVLEAVDYGVRLFCSCHSYLSETRVSADVQCASVVRGC